MTFSYEFERNVTQDLPDFRNWETFGGYYKFFSISQNQTYLLDLYGNLHPDFPLPGNTGFDLYDLHKNGEKILITGTENGSVIAYKIAF